MKGLNFSGWQKVGEDKKTTTLKHDKGHMMTLAHSKLPKIQQEALKRLKMAEGGEVADQKPQAPVTVNVGTPSPAISQPVQSAQPVPVQVPNVPQAAPVLLPNGSMSAPGAAEATQQGAKLGAQVQAAQSAAAVPQQQQYLNQTQNLNQDFTNNLNDVKQKTDEFSDYVKANPIKENAYLENMGAGRKMATAVGLLFSGAGAGLSGQPNIAYDFLNKQIDRNIQAQKDRFGQQSTVWGAYKDLYHNEQVANDLARVHALDMLNHQAALTAAQLGTPAAAATLLDIQGKIAPERNKLILDSAGNLSSVPNNPKNVPPGTSHGLPDQGSHKVNPNQSLIDQGIISGKPSLGNPGAEASVPGNEKKKSVIEPDEYADSGILKPNAQNILDGLRYTPKAKDEIDQIKQQYNSAQIADRLLNQLHDVHQTLYKDAVQGGHAGYIRRHDPTSAIPFIGEGVSRTFVQPATANETNKDYDLNRTRIVGDIAAALRGTNISGEEINHIVSANSPEPGDSPELVAKKERAIRLFIKNNVSTSLLKDWHLAK